jgi:acyl-CoA thioesterase
MDEKLIRNVKDYRFARLLGIELTEVREGYALTRLDLNENHLNGVGKVQGGVIFTLADYAFAAASNSSGCTTVGLNVNITYFKSPSGKSIRAEAREISVQNRISGYRVDVLDDDGSLIASFSGLGYRKKQ